MILDSEIHDLQMEIARLQDKKRLLTDCEIELKQFGLEGMSWYVDTNEYEYMEDKNNMYFDIFKKYFSKGW